MYKNGLRIREGHTSRPTGERLVILGDAGCIISLQRLLVRNGMEAGRPGIESDISKFVPVLYALIHIPIGLCLLLFL